MPDDKITFIVPQRFIPDRLGSLDPGFAADISGPQDWGFDLAIPYDQLSVFVRAVESSAPVPQVPLFASAELGLDAESLRLVGDPSVRALTIDYPLGVVGTDHVGYGSFDLWVLRNVRVVGAVRNELLRRGLLGSGMPRLTVELRRLLVLPYKDPSFAFEALHDGIRAPDFICLNIDLDEVMMDGRDPWPPMPSMQTPNILDWRLSPGSFSMSGALIVGADGCETLLPANLASQLFRLRQTVRTPEEVGLGQGSDSNDDGSGDFGTKPTGDAFLGYSVEYHAEWFPLGHSLGRIAYSLPLAPAEKINISIVDWSRTDTTARDEKTALAEQLNHATLRDRVVTEAVEMVVSEDQSGSSFMAGLGSSAGAGASVGLLSLGGGLAFGLGGASTSTSGVRKVVGNTSQRVTDAFHQASSALRELRSTVVVQGAQAEAAGAQTRVVVNYNHSHALTILYYEVLHHYRVLTRPASARPLLLIRHDMPKFDPGLVERHRQVIERVLLDERLRGCLDVVSRRACLEENFQRESDRRATLGDPLDDALLSDITITVRSGDAGLTDNLMVNVVTTAGASRIACNFADEKLTGFLRGPDIVTPPTEEFFPNILINTGNSFELQSAPPAAVDFPLIKPNAEFTFVIRPILSVRWKNVTAMEFRRTMAPGSLSPGGPDWIIENVRIATATGPSRWVMFDGKPDPNAVIGDEGTLLVPVQAFKATPGSVDDLLTDDERCCLRKLKMHLDAHRGYYWRAVFLAEDAADRALRLATWKFEGKALLDMVDNVAVDFVGDCLALPIAAGTEAFAANAFGVEPDAFAQDVATSGYVEQILTLPSRGVFAEAKLGHCNASELIDPTRFWDWQTSPIPDDAPPIAAASTGTRAVAPASLTPTSFPSSLINIVNPSALPDPAGLGSASSLLSALGPFRDQSGAKELGSFLETLSNNATKLASQGLQGAQTAGLMNTIRGANELTPTQKTELIGDLLTGQVKKANQPASTTPATSTGTGSTGTEGTPAPGTPSPGTPTSGTPTGTPPVDPTVAPAPTTPAKPKPKVTPGVSSKTKPLTLVFAFDTNDVMTGRWNVTLFAGGEIRSQNWLIDTVTGKNGVLVGNRMEMVIPASFGGTDDVTVQINGSIQQVPQALSGKSNNYQFSGWGSERVATGVISRAEYDKASTVRVTQATEVASFKLTTTRSDSETDSKVGEKSAGIEVGAEAGAEVKGGVGPAEVKATVTVTGKETLDWKITNATTTLLTTGTVEEVEFTGKHVASSAPFIKAVL